MLYLATLAESPWASVPSWAPRGARRRLASSLQEEGKCSGLDQLWWSGHVHDSGTGAVQCTRWRRCSGSGAVHRWPGRCTGTLRARRGGEKPPDTLAHCQPFNWNAGSTCSPSHWKSLSVYTASSIERGTWYLAMQTVAKHFDFQSTS